MGGRAVISSLRQDLPETPPPKSPKLRSVENDMTGLERLASVDLIKMGFTYLVVVMSSCERELVRKMR